VLFVFSADIRFRSCVGSYWQAGGSIHITNVRYLASASDRMFLAARIGSPDRPSIRDNCQNSNTNPSELVNIHRSYVAEQIACLFGVHKNTVGEWIKTGLPTSDNRRPMLVLANFLNDRRKKNKPPCQPGEIYCVRCRAPKFPGGGMAEYRPVTETSGNLMALCLDCNSIMNRGINPAYLSHFPENWTSHRSLQVHATALLLP
jgi:hypothetical protein